MFTRDKLIRSFPHLYMESFPPMEHQDYHTGSEGGGGGQIVWGLKTDFRDPLHFWVVAFRRYFQEFYVFPPIEEFGSYEELLNVAHPIVQNELEKGRYALCEPLSFDQFCTALFNFPAKIVRDLRVNSRKNYSSAMQMENEWNHQVILVECSEDYFLLQWGTGA